MNGKGLQSIHSKYLVLSEQDIIWVNQRKCLNAFSRCKVLKCKNWKLKSIASIFDVGKKYGCYSKKITVRTVAMRQNWFYRKTEDFFLRRFLPTILISFRKHAIKKFENVFAVDWSAISELPPIDYWHRFIERSCMYKLSLNRTIGRRWANGWRMNSEYVKKSNFRIRFVYFRFLLLVRE